MVILTPLILARRTNWAKSVTLLPLTQARQAQDAASVRALISEFCQVDWALLPLSTRR